MTRKVAGLVQFFWPGRRSSVVEQRTRNAQVIGSSPIAGSSYGSRGAVRRLNPYSPLPRGEGAGEGDRSVTVPGSLFPVRVSFMVAATDGHGSNLVAKN